MPDDLRPGFTRTHSHGPGPDRTHEGLAAHHGSAVIPARPSGPRDRAKAGPGALQAERWVLAALRHRTFLGLAEANAAITERVAWPSARPLEKLPGSCRTMLEALDRPALRPLPARPSVRATRRTAKVNVDHRDEVERHRCPVPCQLVGQRLDIPASARVVEVFHRGRRVGSHPRSAQQGGLATLLAHMPEAHRLHAARATGRIVAWAERTWPASAVVVAAIMAADRTPSRAFARAWGVMRLSRRYGDERLEAACAQTLAVRRHSTPAPGRS